MRVIHEFVCKLSGHAVGFPEPKRLPTGFTNPEARAEDTIALWKIDLLRRRTVKLIELV